MAMKHMKGGRKAALCFGLLLAGACTPQYLLTDLGTFPGDTSSTAVDINDSRIVVGYSSDGSDRNHDHAFRWIDHLQDLEICRVASFRPAHWRLIMTTLSLVTASASTADPALGRCSGSAEQRQLIEQLFWEERTETELADALGTNQSTVNRRKQAILKSLGMKLCDGDGCRRFSA